MFFFLKQEPANVRKYSTGFCLLFLPFLSLLWNFFCLYFEIFVNFEIFFKDFEYAVERFLLHGFESPLIDISFAHYQSIEVFKH